MSDGGWWVCIVLSVSVAEWNKESYFLLVKYVPLCRFTSRRARLATKRSQGRARGASVPWCNAALASHLQHGNQCREKKPFCTAGC